MTEPVRRFVDPRAVVLVDYDGKPTGRMRMAGTTYYNFPWFLFYSTPHPRSGRHQTQRYRVYRVLAEPTAPFILVRGERFYLTPSLVRKVLSS